jgi:hypothetical protein
VAQTIGLIRLLGVLHTHTHTLPTTHQPIGAGERRPRLVLRRRHGAREAVHRSPAVELASQLRAVVRPLRLAHTRGAAELVPAVVVPVGVVALMMMLLLLLMMMMTRLVPKRGALAYQNPRPKTQDPRHPNVMMMMMMDFTGV